MTCTYRGGLVTEVAVYPDHLQRFVFDRVAMVAKLVVKLDVRVVRVGNGAPRHEVIRPWPWRTKLRLLLRWTAHRSSTFETRHAWQRGKGTDETI